MRFTLIYDGPLPAQTAKDGRVDFKQEIRTQFHSQLAELWNTHPAIHKDFWRWIEYDKKGDLEAIKNSTNITTFDCGNFRFLPLVTRAAYLTCELDILFLRQEPKGSVVNAYGDLDNRLKVLFDALRIPLSPKEIPPNIATLDNPFFCLLEDDSLITGFKITSEKLLEPHASTGSFRVRLVINVTVKVFRLTLGNIAFGGD
jgi:hypothetical protein